MKAYFFIFIYGMLAMTGLFLAIFWGQLSYKRFGKMRPEVWKKDHYFWFATALAINSVGSVLLFGTRAHGNIVNGLSPILTGWDGVIIGLGALIILFGKVLMVGLADLERKKSRYLGWMVGLSVLWFFIVGWIV